MTMTTNLTMTSIISGHWPERLRSPTEADSNMHSKIPLNPIGEATQLSQRTLPYPISTEERLQAPSSLSIRVESQSIPTTPYPASPNTADELFFDCSTSGQNSPALQNEEGASTSYLIFEPVIEEDSSIENTDWRRYDPPQELLSSQEGITRDLEGILAPSIERVQARHIEEQERRAAASRIERPLARAGRALVRPRRQISITGALDTTHLIPPPGLSDTSETSLSSNDSGYGSSSPGTEPSRSPRSANRRSFGLSAFFKRKERTVVDPEELDEKQLPRPRSIEAWPLSDSPLPPPLARPAPVPESLTGECVSCLDDFATGELIRLTCHSYCSGCFQRLINNALESETHWPAKCCLNPIPSSSVLPHLSTTTAKRYRHRQAEWSIPAGERIYCAQPTCSVWISPKHINTVTHSAKCPKCSHRSCTTCRGPHHGNVDCPQDPALQATINLAEMEGWKRCYSCHALVEHNKGCRHMTCRCKAQFYYICGLKWRTCACTDAQLATIQQRAETRRADEDVRNARATQEAEEERAAIRAVEEFMRAEEQRILREVEVRRQREEEERRRQEEERRRREEQRIAAVNRKFRGLSTELEALSDIQRVLMAERYEFEAELLKKEREDVLDTLSIRYPAELQYLFNESSTKIRGAEAKFQNEYIVRLAEERRIEDQYVDELREFWKGKLEGEYKIREARAELRRDQDKEYRIWDAYRRQQLDALREGERRKMDALNVKQDSEIKAVNGRAKIDDLEWRRKIFAEKRWVEEVTRERMAMLGEMEGAEYAREG